MNIQANSEPQNAAEMAAQLTELGIGLFPGGRAGGRALALWSMIRGPLLRGKAVTITVNALGLTWHRMELKRARDAMIEIDLIRATEDGRYILGRYDWLEENMRLDLHVVRELEEFCRIMEQLSD